MTYVNYFCIFFLYEDFFKNPNQFFTYQNLHLMLYSSRSKKEYVKGEKAAAQRETSSVLNQKHVIFGGFI